MTIVELPGQTADGRLPRRRRPVCGGELTARRPRKGLVDRQLSDGFADSLTEQSERFALLGKSPQEHGPSRSWTSLRLFFVHSDDCVVPENTLDVSMGSPISAYPQASGKGWLSGVTSFALHSACAAVLVFVGVLIDVPMVEGEAAVAVVIIGDAADDDHATGETAASATALEILAVSVADVSPPADLVPSNRTDTQTEAAEPVEIEPLTFKPLAPPKFEMPEPVIAPKLVVAPKPVEVDESILATDPLAKTSVVPELRTLVEERKVPIVDPVEKVEIARPVTPVEQTELPATPNKPVLPPKKPVAKRPESKKSETRKPDTKKLAVKKPESSNDINRKAAKSETAFGKAKPAKVRPRANAKPVQTPVKTPENAIGKAASKSNATAIGKG